MKIEVFLYHSGGSLLHPIPKDQAPKSWIVDAEPVAGETGIFAVFPHPESPDTIVYAQGDDGHWWYAGSFNKHWLPAIIKQFESAK
jgi:hypothetical protein